MLLRSYLLISAFLFTNLGFGQSCAITDENRPFFEDVLVIRFEDGWEQTGFLLNVDGFRNGVFTSLQGFVRQSDTLDSLPNFGISQIQYFKPNYTKGRHTRKLVPLLKDSVEIKATMICPRLDLAFIEVTDSMLIAKKNDVWKRFRRYTLKGALANKAVPWVNDSSQFYLTEAYQQMVRPVALSNPRIMDQTKLSKINRREGTLNWQQLYTDSLNRYLIAQRKSERGTAGGPVFDPCDSTVVAMHIGAKSIYSLGETWNINVLLTTLNGFVRTDTISEATEDQFKGNKSYLNQIEGIHFFYTKIDPVKPNTTFDFQKQQSLQEEELDLKVKPYFIKNMAAVIDQYYRTENASNTLEKMENMMDTTTYKGFGKKKKLLRGWNLKRVKKAKRDYGESVTLNLFQATQAYAKLKSEMRQGNYNSPTYREALDSANQAMRRISNKIMQSGTYLAASDREIAYWKTIYANPEQDLDALLGTVAKDLDRFNRIGNGQQKVDDLKARGRLWEAIVVARELSDIPVPDGQRSFQHDMEHQVRSLNSLLMARYVQKLDSADTLVQLGKYRCAEWLYSKASQMLPEVPYPGQQVVAMRTRQVQEQKKAWMDQMTFETNRFLEHLKQEYDPRHTAILPFDVNQNQMLDRLLFSFEYGLREDAPLVNLMSLRYPVGEYYHPGLDQISNMVSDLLFFLDYRFKDVIDWQKSHINLEGHADGIPYRGKINIRDSDQQGIFNNIDQERVYDCDPVTGKAGKNYRLFADLRKGNSDEKNRALAFQRAFFVAQSTLNNANLQVTPSQICAIIHQQIGGQYRKIEIEFDIQLKTDLIGVRNLLLDSLNCDFTPAAKPEPRPQYAPTQWESPDFPQSASGKEAQPPQSSLTLPVGNGQTGQSPSNAKPTNIAPVPVLQQPKQIQTTNPPKPGIVRPTTLRRE